MDGRYLEAHFEPLANAPGGIAKLRELILGLAVRGKLLPQDPKDEPASVLLKKIEAEKAKLVKEGKIKVPKPLPPIKPEEMPYELPQGWEWVRLGDVTEIIRGITFPASEKSKKPAPGKIACLRTANVQESIEWEDLLYINKSFVKREAQLIATDDIVMSMANSRELVGKVAIVREVPHPEATIGGFLGVIRLHCVLPHFALLLLKSRYARESIIDSASQTTNIANVSVGKLNSFLHPLPPLAEQKRIVAKVDELMALCDRLEKEQERRATVHQAATVAACAALTAPGHGGPPNGEWKRLRDHFEICFDNPESVAELRKSVLQLAVMGRLVPQDPKDEPASVLLKKIEAEKARLVKEGKIRAPKPLPPIKPEETPYELPKGWVAIPFGDFVIEIATGPFGSMIHKSDYVINGIPLINPSHLINDAIVHDASVAVSKKKAKELSAYALSTDDIVMARRGEMGRCAVVEPNANGWLCGTGSFVLRFIPAISRKFVLLFFKTQYAKAYLTGKSVGTTMTNLNHGILNKMPVMLPPLAEQKRIVVRVDELMALCDRLERSLADSRTRADAFANAVVARALA